MMTLNLTPNPHNLPVLFGFPVSPNVRAARLAFHEKGVEIEFRVIGLDAVAKPEYAELHPFRKMPVLRDGDLTLYETPAIMVYAEGVGRGPSLVPAGLLDQARMWQFTGVAQHYLYPRGVMELYFHRVLAPLFGLEAKDAVADAAVAAVAAQLDALERALTASAHLAGPALSFADLYCGAMVDYVARTPDGAELLARRPAISAWLDSLRARDSFRATFPSMLAN
ncbi:MAG: glutathione S-transferase family protein [Hyphomicrobiales bacterium]|nr:glutathione S-transferase family protein [Hyphomicrobiales bacterium]